MEDLRSIVASNLIRLRTEAGMTQAELGAKLNYSDKTISKWERADGLPDANALKTMGQIFNVPVDYILNSHDQWVRPVTPEEEEKADRINRRAVIAVSVLSIITCAVMVFVILWLCGIVEWRVFVFALPLCLIALLVMNSVWNHGKFNVIIVFFLVLSIFVTIYLVLLPVNPWQLFLIALPAELIVIAAFNIRKLQRK